MSVAQLAAPPAVATEPQTDGAATPDRTLLQRRPIGFPGQDAGAALLRMPSAHIAPLQSVLATWNVISIIIIWLLHNLVEARFDLFRYLLLGDQPKPWELHPHVMHVIGM